MRIRIAAATVSVAAAATLAALGTPTLSQATDGGRHPEPSQSRPQAAEAAARSTGDCVGGAQKKAFTGGQPGWYETTSAYASTVPGTTFQFRGPSSGKDTVFVDVTAFDVYAASGQYGQVRVTLDGTTLTPTDAATEWFSETDNLTPYAGQFCGKVGPGTHKVKVWLDSYYAGSTWLYNTMAHVEVAN